MIIAVDIREWQPGKRTGIGRFLEVFLGAATTARPQDRFLLVGDATCEVRVQASNIDVSRIVERWTMWWDQVTLPRALARSGACVLYSPYIKVPLLAGIPVVSTMHDLTFLLRRDYNRRRADLLLNPPFRLFCCLIARRAAAIIVDSHTSARDIRRLLGAKPERLRTIPLATSSGFRPDADPEVDAGIRGKYGLKAGYVFYVGGFWPHKNVPLLVRAHAALPEPVRLRHPLILAGNAMPCQIHQLLTAAKGATTTRWIGMIPDADLPALYRGAALFAFPSHYEGFGLPVLEAMACGVPVLCSTAPALVELTANAADHVSPENGATWEEALWVLLNDPVRRAALASRARARADEFTPERMATQILNVLDEVAGRSQ